MIDPCSGGAVRSERNINLANDRGRVPCRNAAAASDNAISLLGLLLEDSVGEPLLGIIETRRREGRATDGRIRGGAGHAILQLAVATANRQSGIAHRWWGELGVPLGR